MPSRGFTNILEGHSPFYSGKDVYSKILPSMPYGNLGLFQVNSMGRSIPDYSGFLLTSWNLPLPISILEYPPATTVGMVTQNSTQPHPGCLPEGGNVHTWFQYFPCQGSQVISPITDTWATAPVSGPSRPWYDEPWRWMPVGQLVNEYKKLSIVRKAHGLNPTVYLTP